MMTRLLCLLLLFVPLAHASDHPVMEGVNELTTGGNPASLVVFGDATPLLVREDGRVFAAATEVGKGRVVTLGHTGYFGNTDPATQRFLQQAIAWLHKGEATPRVFGLSQQRLDALGADARSVNGDVPTINLANVDILVCTPQEWHGAERLKDVRTFLENGGGAIIGECAWGQLQLKRAESVGTLAANVLLHDAGIVYTERIESSTNTHAPEHAHVAHIERALSVVANDDAPEQAFASRVLSEALMIVPLDATPRRAAAETNQGEFAVPVPTTHPLFGRISTFRNEHTERVDRAFREMDTQPLTPESHPIACAMFPFDARFWSSVRFGENGPHPSANAFPGLHDPEAEPVTRELTIDPSTPGWHSTGLWLPAGGTARLLVHRQNADPGVSLRVGCWLDPQDFDERVRMPNASRVERATDHPRMHVLRPRASVHSPIGGPVYVEIDVALSYRDAIPVSIAGVIEMPYFRLGETTLAEWDAMRENPSAPWCELASDELVFTLPMDMVQDCERPDLVMQHWDRVHRAMHELNPRSLNHWPHRQYRYVAEKRLSWGYMYCPSNAPIVIPMSAADEMVDLDEYDAQGAHELWGHYHEMGHAHQSDAWTFNGTTEVTVNIFTVFALHTVNGYPLDSEYLRTSPETAWQTFEKHKANGAPFDTWKRDPFLALQTYAMLWHEFGFKAFKETFARYRDGRVETPRSDDAERDTFVRTFSEVVQRDLSGYFDAWGVPITDAVRTDLATLEEWMPTEPE